MPKVSSSAGSTMAVFGTSTIPIPTNMPVKTFHQSISKILFVSQFFGIFPISNLLSKNVNDLNYRWLSIPTIYATIILILNSLEFSTFLFMLFKYGLSFHKLATLQLFVVCILEQIYFWRLAINWPKIMRVWQQIESIFLRLPYTLYINYNVQLRLYILSAIVLLNGLFEHTLLLFNAFDKNKLERELCNLNVSFWELLYQRERTHLSNLLPYQPYWLPFVEWINLTLAYPRSFTDCFIICVSCVFAAHLRQLHLRIMAAQTKSMPDMFWTEIREHFLMLKFLLQTVNKEIALLVLLACSNNMYFICYQLFNSFLNISGSFVATLAFWYSLLSAIARTILTLYVSSTIHECSKQILLCLRDIPSRFWSLEVQRLSEQLTRDTTALSASGFFFLTRKFILAMASTIVTFELMVAGVINKGNIQQVVNYCQDYVNETMDQEF